MNAAKIIAAEETVAVAVLAGKDLVQHSMPRPKPIVAALMFYGALAWVSALGNQAARVSAAVGGVVMLALLVAPVGAAFVGQLQRLVLGAEDTGTRGGVKVTDVPGVEGPVGKPRVRSRNTGAVPGLTGPVGP